MVGQRLLPELVSVGTLVALLMLLGVSSAAAAGSTCTPTDIAAGTCDVSAGHDGRVVTVDGKAKVPAGPGSNTPPSDPKPAPYNGRPGYTVTLPVTLVDIAKFRPNPGVDRMQPDGWMIVGLPTNFYARASQHVKSGTLLDESAYVRFTPARYAWTYGDGATRTSSTAGATWEALGLHEFDATATSHIYRNPGRYFIDLEIGYSPEYRFASSTDWIPLAGYVWAPANRLVAIAAAGAKTVLVEDECTANPHGPGC